MIALAMVTIVTPIFIGGQVHLILHLLDGDVRGEFDVMLILETCPIFIGLEDYLSRAALRVGLLGIHDLLDTRDCGELVLVWNLFLGGLEEWRVLGGFYTFGKSSNSYAHRCYYLEYRKEWKLGNYERLGM